MRSSKETRKDQVKSEIQQEATDPMFLHPKKLLGENYRFTTCFNGITDPILNIRQDQKDQENEFKQPAPK